MNHLTRACPACGGDGQIALTFRGGTDPDARAMRCDECDDGLVPLLCESYKCGKSAVRIVEDAPLCEGCARRAKAELREVS